MAETGSVKVRIDDDGIKERMREFLAQAWDEGRAAGFMKRPSASNPYRP